MGRESTPPSEGGPHGPSRATIPVVQRTCVLLGFGLRRKAAAGVACPPRPLGGGRERAAMWAHGAESTPAVVPVPSGREINPAQAENLRWARTVGGGSGIGRGARPDAEQVAARI